ncbi:ISL3 family transposase [Thiolapillus sp.]|uniref:ISL3 family transposase n=3 Tax=Thiolapillus sp. TaxID=2017437 RepID=UPI003AF98516
MELEEHYSQLLGINSPWEIYDVELKVDESRLDIWIEYMDDKGASPECGAACPRHDTRKERTWRHLDTMQFATYLHCNVPRVRCEKHDVKSIRVPWAEKNSRFTLLFEAFAIRVLNAAHSVEEARKLLGLNWHQVDAIKARAVKRGLARRQATKIDCLGIDEKQFRSGHDSVSNLYDLTGGRVLDIVEGRTENDCKQLIEQALTPEQRAQVTAVALDMWQAYANAVSQALPKADIVHDRFHISLHLNDAVDSVRRAENKALNKIGDNRLKGSRYCWLANEENIDKKRAEQFDVLKTSDLKVARAWAIKEMFRGFWDYRYAGWAKRHFDRWYAWAIRSRLTPIKKKAKMIKNHLPNILTYLEFRVSNIVPPYIFG